VWRHAANIGKLFAGTESKIGQRAAPAAPTHPHPPSQSHASHHSGKHR
jgi:glycerol-3-phosphate acyltransferase PlsY